MGRRALDQTEALRQCREVNAQKDAEIERLLELFRQIKEYETFWDLDAFVVGCVIQALENSSVSNPDGGDK